MTQVLFHGDFLQSGPLVTFDHVFTDPPYSPHVHDRATTSADRAYGTAHNDLGFDALTPELRRAIAVQVAGARKWSLVYTDIEGAHLWIEDVEHAGGTYIRAIPWIRWSTPQKSGDRPVQACELVLVFWGSQKGSKRPHWHGPGNMTEIPGEGEFPEVDVLREKCMRGKAKHKTQKPLDQALALVEWFSDPGDLILDPCAGRGTFGVAAAMTDRSFLGYEIQASEASLGNHRIAAAAAGVYDDRDRKALDRYVQTRNVINRPAPARREKILEDVAETEFDEPGEPGEFEE